MNYNTEEWLSIRVNADKLIYCKTGTLSRSKFPFSFQSAVQVFFEDVFSLSFSLSRERNFRGIQPIAEKILKTETKPRSKSSSCSERPLNGSALFFPGQLCRHFSRKEPLTLYLAKFSVYPITGGDRQFLETKGKLSFGRRMGL